MPGARRSCELQCQQKDGAPLPCRAFSLLMACPHGWGSRCSPSHRVAAKWAFEAVHKPPKSALRQSASDLVARLSGEVWVPDERRLHRLAGEHVHPALSADGGRRLRLWSRPFLARCPFKPSAFCAGLVLHGFAAFGVHLHRAGVAVLVAAIPLVRFSWLNELPAPVTAVLLCGFVGLDGCCVIHDPSSFSARMFAHTLNASLACVVMVFLSLRYQRHS